MTSQPDKVLERILQRFARGYDPDHPDTNLIWYENLGIHDAESYALVAWERMSPREQAEELEDEKALMRAQVMTEAMTEAAALEPEIPEDNEDKTDILDEYVLGAEEIAVRFGYTERTMRKKLKEYRKKGISKKIGNKWAMKNSRINEQIKVKREKK